MAESGETELLKPATPCRPKLGCLNLPLPAMGIRRLAREIGLSHQTICGWTRVPQSRLFRVAAITGLAPEALRPDLAPWISEEKARRRMMAAFERFGSAPTISPALATRPPSNDDLFKIDMVITLQACWFVAERRSLGFPSVMVEKKPEPSAARSLAMALAHIPGRASSTHIALTLNVSRQNVDNASERYLRARDGDDPEDVVDGRVIERGRPRRPKAADPELWALEEQFTAVLAGEAKEKRR